ncbi:TonB-dependent receptor [Hirschia litorea]|uniref:TonB-dependent receptor n=1 Tax=Hirschia litorea TaxID=1199156 RepID=A0ABW2IPS3_9PROT
MTTTNSVLKAARIKTSVLALTTALALPAIAQESNTEEDAAVMDTIVIEGSLLSRKQGIMDKRDASQILEALSADELGQLPDKNVGESLNRLAGVSMLVEKGEGRYVQIRGINPSLNNVTINGANLGSPEVEGGGRQAPLDIIAGGVLGAVQVIKAPTPDMDAQGIGGTVNVETKSPFDRDENFYGYVNARYGFEEISPISGAYGGSNPYGLDATIAGKTADKKFGWLVAGSLSDREYIAPGFYQDDWVNYEADTATNSVGGYAPEAVKNNYYVIGRKRLNLNGVLEFRPTDNAKYFARGFYATWEEFQHRNRYSENFTSDIAFSSADAGTSGENRIEANIRLEEPEKEIFTFAVGGENLINNFTIDYEVNTNSNSIDEPYSYWEWRSAAIFGPNTFSIDGEGLVSITPDAGTPDRQEPSLFDFRRARFQNSKMEEDGLAAQFNVIWDLNDQTQLKTGMKYRTTDRSWDYSRTRYDGGALDLDLGSSDAFTKGAFTNCNDSGCRPNILMDVDAMNAFLADSGNADFFELNTSDSFSSEFASDYSIEESILAGFAMGRHDFGAVDIIAGVRVEATDIDSSGYLFVDGGAQKVDDGGDYINVLPALLANWDVTDSLKLRGSVTRALGRPEYDQIAPRSSFSEEFGEGSLNIGNPDLEARVSWNYDASIEWYPNELTLLSAAVFIKDISNDIVGLSEQYNGESDIKSALAARGLTGAVDVDGLGLEELNISTTQNAGSSELKGLELIAQTQFDNFLPASLSGFGASVSATFLDGETEVNGETLPLLNQAERSYAFSAFYQNHGVDASISYAYNDSFATGINLSNSDLNLDQGAFGRWDAKVSYDVMDNLKIFVEGVNLNDEPTTEFQGRNERRNTEAEYVGRTVYFGLSYGF